MTVYIIHICKQVVLIMNCPCSSYIMLIMKLYVSLLCSKHLEMTTGVANALWGKLCDLVNQLILYRMTKGQHV